MLTTIKNKGIALMEVLISTLIVAFGSLAIVVLLSNLNASSSLSKTRDEALSLAKSKIEKLSNYLDKSQYLQIKSGKKLLIKGIHKNYDLFWEVTDLNNAYSKQIKIIVKWKAAKNTIESIQLINIIYWNDPLKSASIASYGSQDGFIYLSPNQYAQVGDMEEIQIPQGVISQKLPYKMKKYIDPQGNVVILDQNNRLLLTLSAKTEQSDSAKDFLTISGVIYYQGKISSDLTMAASQGAYCLFPIEDSVKKISASSWQFAKYYCLVANNWHGKIGILNNNSQQNIFCPDNNREYLLYALNKNQHLKQQGIGASFTQQDFVISASAMQDNCLDQIQQLQKLLEQFQPNTIINAENHTIMVIDKVHNLSGLIHFSEQLLQLKNIHLELSIASQKHVKKKYDCRLLNPISSKGAAYSCVVEVANPQQNHWQGKIKGIVYKSDFTNTVCTFSHSFDKQHKSAILDLDLALLCP
ncbi:MAG: hypothetical protein QM479_08020 [Pseudomonadota bacterium]